MSQQIRTQNFVQSVPYVPGGIATIQLPRMSDVETYLLDLVGTFTYPAGATGALRTLGPQALVSRVELIADGKTTVLSAPGWAFGIASDRTFEGSGGGSYMQMTSPAANALGTLQTQFYVDLMQFDGIKPKESNLRARNLSILELKITFAPWSECFVDPASVPTVYNVNVFVDANYCTELDPETTKPAFLVKRTSQIIGAESSNSAYQVRLPSGNIIRSVKFYTHINGVATDTILQNVTASNGIDTRVVSSARALRVRQRGYKAPTTGFLELDFARQLRGDVLISNAWAVPSPSEPILTLDYAGGPGRRIEMVISEIMRG